MEEPVGNVGIKTKPFNAHFLSCMLYMCVCVCGQMLRGFLKDLVYTKPGRDCVKPEEVERLDIFLHDLNLLVAL